MVYKLIQKFHFETIGCTQSKGKNFYTDKISNNRLLS
jgi:hypothetical protein